MAESLSGAQKQSYPPLYCPRPLSSLSSNVRTSPLSPITCPTSLLRLPEFDLGTAASLLPLPSYSYVMSCNQEELWDIIQSLYAQHKSLHDLCTVQKAQLDATNAYLAVTQRRIAKLKLLTKQLTSKQAKRRKPKKVQTRRFTLAEPHARSDAEAAAVVPDAKETIEGNTQTHWFNSP